MLSADARLATVDVPAEAVGYKSTDRTSKMSSNGPSCMSSTDLSLPRLDTSSLLTTTDFCLSRQFTDSSNPALVASDKTPDMANPSKVAWFFGVYLSTDMPHVRIILGARQGQVHPPWVAVPGMVPEHGHGLGKVGVKVVIGGLSPPDRAGEPYIWEKGLKPTAKGGLTRAVP